MDDISPMRFIYMFLDFVDNHGIFDEFDAEANRMITSKGVRQLIEIARELQPERMAFDEAAIAMRELSEEEREFLISSDEEGVIVNMRDYFAEEMSRNGGARGLLQQLAQASKAGDFERVDNLLEVAREFDEKEL